MLPQDAKELLTKEGFASIDELKQVLQEERDSLGLLRKNSSQYQEKQDSITHLATLLAALSLQPAQPASQKLVSLSLTHTHSLSSLSLLSLFLSLSLSLLSLFSLSRSALLAAITRVDTNRLHLDTDKDASSF